MSKTMLAPEKTETDIDALPLVCFVCTGNTCRSPMAAALVNAGGRARAVSAGLAPCVGAPIAPHAADALLLAGIPATENNPYTAHSAAPLTAELVARADKVVGMTGEHLLSMLMAFPAESGKLTAMPAPIRDPFMGSLADYQTCLADLQAGLTEMGLL